VLYRSEGLQQEAAPKQQARANNGWEMQEEANLNQNAGKYLVQSIQLLRVGLTTEQISLDSLDK
jgi:hypothetical protein